MVASHVLNEGVDVPAASIAIILSGTGSAREYIQRLGRVLRKGNLENKQAILYEVIAENTSEERTSERRRGVEKEPQKGRERRDGTGNLQVMYGNGSGRRSYKAAEKSSDSKYKTRKPPHKQMNIWDDED